MRAARLPKLVVVATTLGAFACASCGDDGSVSQADLSSALVKTSVCTGDEIDVFTIALLGTVLGVSPELAATVAEQSACLGGSSTCDAVLGCIGLDTDSPCDADAQDDEWCESGVTVVECQELDNGLELLMKRDCIGSATGGDVCTVTDWGSAVCSTGSCTEEGERCAGDLLVDCDGGIEHQLDCGGLGMACIETDDDAFCGYAGSSCADDRCEGSTIVSCQDGIEGASVDCKSIDPSFTCREAFGEVSCALPSGSEECDVLLDLIACEGDVARACLGGKFFDFDCGSFLGAHCESDGLGVARCVSGDWP